MRVTLSYSIITIEGAPKWLDSIGRYKLRVRKSPEEMKAERERKKSYGSTTKVVPYRFEEKTVMERDPDDPSTLYFMAGLWPRVQENLDRRDIKYEIVDNRDPSKKPPLDLSRLGDVEFRENQDVAIALIATSDCGIINTPTGFGKTFLVSMICKLLPTLRIVVTTGSSSVVATNYEYISKVIPGEVGCLTGKMDTTKGKRVIVTTLKSLPKIPTENVDLLICDECLIRHLALVKESELLGAHAQICMGNQQPIKGLPKPKGMVPGKGSSTIPQGSREASPKRSHSGNRVNDIVRPRSNVVRRYGICMG